MEIVPGKLCWGPGWDQRLSLQRLGIAGGGGSGTALIIWGFFPLIWRRGKILGIHVIFLLKEKWGEGALAFLKICRWGGIKTSFECYSGQGGGDRNVLKFLPHPLYSLTQSPPLKVFLSKYCRNPCRPINAYRSFWSSKHCLSACISIKTIC